MSERLIQPQPNEQTPDKELAVSTPQPAAKALGADAGKPSVPGTTAPSAAPKPSAIATKRGPADAVPNWLRAPSAHGLVTAAPVGPTGSDKSGDTDGDDHGRQPRGSGELDFGSPEHQRYGDDGARAAGYNGRLHGPTADELAGKMYAPTHFSLSHGDIVMLSGDYFDSPREGR